MTTRWNSQWETESKHNYWLEPDETVVKLMKKLDKSKIKDVLDLGCGIGRHTLCFAKEGFDVTAVDSSSNALDLLRHKLDTLGLHAKVLEGDYSQDLFKEESFDFILAFNVIYHGYRETFKDAIQLIYKWLRPNGSFFFTCPTRRDDKHGNGEPVALNTYKSLNSVHPGDIHYFADESDIIEFLKEFRKTSKNIYEHYWDNKGTKQFGSYWEIFAEK
jgi:tellurite methyltransferase